IAAARGASTFLGRFVATVIIGCLKSLRFPGIMEVPPARDSRGLPFQMPARLAETTTRRAELIYLTLLFSCADFPGNTDKLHGRSTEAVVSCEACGVRGACSRCRMCGAVRKREQAPRTPYASRHLVPVMPAWGQTRPTCRSH